MKKNIRKTTLTNQKYLQYYYSLTIQEKANEVAIWLNDNVKKNNELYYKYDGKVWGYLPYTDQDPLALLILDFFQEKRIRFNKEEVRNIRGILPYLIKKIGTYKPQFLVFKNGLYNKETGEFHSKFKRNFYLTYRLNMNYPVEPKSTRKFNQWLNEITDNNKIKKDCILASFYLIITNNYNWNIFLEITGESEFDRHIFTRLSQILVGKQNIVELSQLKMNSSRVLNAIINKPLIISTPIGIEYHNEGVIEKIVRPQKLIVTYRDEKSLKYKPKSIYLVNSRSPLLIKNKNLNLINQRVLLFFERKLPKNLQSTALEIELVSEIDGILQQILFRFKNDPSEARKILLKQKNNIKALIIKHQQQASYKTVAECKPSLFTEKEKEQMRQLKLIKKYERILAKDKLTIDELFVIMKNNYV